MDSMDLPNADEDHNQRKKHTRRRQSSASIVNVKSVLPIDA